MAKDDYQVIVFKVLAYLYTVVKGNQVFDQLKYDKAIGKKAINEEYLLRVYKMMAEEGLISGVKFTTAWGADLIPLFDEKELVITVHGIRYLEENDGIKSVGSFLKDNADTIATMLLEFGLQHLMQ